MARRREQLDFKSPLEVVGQLGTQLSQAATQVNSFTYVPHGKQTVFHKATEDIRLYIGGNRSGKTVGGVMEGIYFLRKNHPYQKLPMSEHEPCRGRVVGVDFDNGIAKILLPQYASSIPKSLLINGSWEDSYNGSTRTLTLKDKSFVEFMSYDQDTDKFAGTSRHFVHCDEEPPKPIYNECFARIIDANGRIWITMTPVEGMTWVYDTLYEPGILGTKPDIRVIVVDLTENPHVSDEQKTKFINNLDEDEREARIQGKFVQMGGLIYKKFDPTPGGKHVIDKSLKPPKGWMVGISLDHGFNNPTAVGWHMVSPEGDVITYAEHYYREKTIDWHAREIKKEIMRQGRFPDILIADPSIKTRDAITNTSILQEYAKHGLNFTLGNNDVKAGITRVNSYLELRKQWDGKERPLWHVTKDCPNHIKEMSRYRWKTYVNKKDQYEKNPYDEPHKKDDHAMDSLRYFIMSRPSLNAEDESNPQEEASRNNMPAPGVVGIDATAKDFSSLEDYADKLDYSGAQPSGKMEIEYDEHLGGVW
jgi:phage terminase large subunit-like protein